MELYPTGYVHDDPVHTGDPVVCRFKGNGVIGYVDDLSVFVSDAVLGEKCFPLFKALFPEIFHPDPVFIVNGLSPQTRVTEDLNNAISEYFFHKLIHKKDFTIDQRQKNDGFKDAIVARYRLLLQFLATKGLVFSPEYTHLDIQKQMITAGLPHNAVASVTQSFEIARYSPYPIKGKDVTLFNKNILTLVKDYGV